MVGGLESVRPLPLADLACVGVLWIATRSPHQVLCQITGILSTHICRGLVAKNYVYRPDTVAAPAVVVPQRASMVCLTIPQILAS